MDKTQLTLTGRQCGEDGEELVTKTITTADYHERNGSHYFFYEEIMEDTSAVVKNTLKLKGGILELTRRGAVSTRMVFESGKDYCMDYATPYGCLKMEIATKSVKSSFQNGKTEIIVDYSLTSDGRFLSDCRLTIEAIPPCPALPQMGNG